ncbi:MAG TPA: DUF4062 domain-containing protein [Agromyces sp.]
MNPAAGGIRTPDQRLRVFVSSTLKELAPERRAVRAAIERLALAPVMFELGARPHPPRSLYRAYLEQSDIFVGIFWEQYGWIAPGEEVSGLEDEWNLAPDIPKLIYLKHSEGRHERLERLLGRIRDADGASYVGFTDAAELADLLTADLATLLAERFDSAAARHEPLGRPQSAVFSTEPVRLPSPLTRLIGRTDELDTLTRMLHNGHRLVTITGPGGIGKSRLAVAAAREVESAYPDGVVFVDLAPVLDPGLVLVTLGNALGIRDTGDLPMTEKVSHALAGRRMLLVLDNVEQVVDAAPELITLLEGSRATVLSTSRILLRVRGEQNVPIGPLDSSAAMELFVERARAVKPDFDLSPENAAHVAAICDALDNAPLALELAAARLRVLTPSVLVERLDHALPCSSPARVIFPSASAPSGRPSTGAPSCCRRRRPSCCSASAFFGPVSASTRSSGWQRAWRESMRSTRSVHSSTAVSSASRTADREPGSRCWPLCANTDAISSPNGNDSQMRRTAMPRSTSPSRRRLTPRPPGTGRWRG